MHTSCTWVEMNEDATDVCAEVAVWGEDGYLISKGTQTGECHDDSELVQIQATLPELLQRIEAFVQFKKHQVNLSNQVEFCHRSSSEGITCARTDAAYIRHSPSRNIPSCRVHNLSGPTAPPLSPLEQLKQDLYPPPSTWSRTKSVRGGPSSSLLGLPERITNIEEYTNLYEGGPTPRNLLQRVRNLEMKILQMEGSSPEYQHASTAATKSLPKSKRTHALLPSGHPAHDIT